MNVHRLEFYMILLRHNVSYSSTTNSGSLRFFGHVCSKQRLSYYRTPLEKPQLKWLKPAIARPILQKTSTSHPTKNRHNKAQKTLVKPFHRTAPRGRRRCVHRRTLKGPQRSFAWKSRWAITTRSMLKKKIG